eukprot:10529520-Alexandrium_andersonii.AAC.1
MMFRVGPHWSRAETRPTAAAVDRPPRGCGCRYPGKRPRPAALSPCPPFGLLGGGPTRSPEEMAPPGFGVGWGLVAGGGASVVE